MLLNISFRSERYSFISFIIDITYRICSATSDQLKAFLFLRIFLYDSLLFLKEGKWAKSILPCLNVGKNNISVISFIFSETIQHFVRQRPWDLLRDVVNVSVRQLDSAPVSRPPAPPPARTEICGPTILVTLQLRTSKQEQNPRQRVIPVLLTARSRNEQQGSLEMSPAADPPYSLIL